MSAGIGSDRSKDGTSTDRNKRALDRERYRLANGDDLELLRIARCGYNAEQCGGYRPTGEDGARDRVAPCKARSADEPEPRLSAGGRRETDARACVYAHFRLPSAIGKVRIRMPVAAKIALQSAGAAAGRPGSPKPVGGASDLTNSTSTTAGACFIRNIR